MQIFGRGQTGFLFEAAADILRIIMVLVTEGAYKRLFLIVGIEITNGLSDNGVVYDVKGFLTRDIVDGRL